MIQPPFTLAPPETQIHKSFIATQENTASRKRLVITSKKFKAFLDRLILVLWNWSSLQSTTPFQSCPKRCIFSARKIAKTLYTQKQSRLLNKSLASNSCSKIPVSTSKESFSWRVTTICRESVKTSPTLHQLQTSPSCRES